MLLLCWWWPHKPSEGFLEHHCTLTGLAGRLLMKCVL